MSCAWVDLAPSPLPRPTARRRKRAQPVEYATPRTARALHLARRACCRLPSWETTRSCARKGASGHRHKQTPAPAPPAQKHGFRNAAGERAWRGWFPYLPPGAGPAPLCPLSAPCRTRFNASPPGGAVVVEVRLRFHRIPRASAKGGDRRKVPLLLRFKPNVSFRSGEAYDRRRRSAARAHSLVTATTLIPESS